MDIREQQARDAAGIADIISAKTRAMRVSEVASILSISERQIYKLALERRIPCFRIGGSLRFDPVGLANWIRQKMLTPSLVQMESKGNATRQRM